MVWSNLYFRLDPEPKDLSCCRSDLQSTEVGCSWSHLDNMVGKRNYGAIDVKIVNRNKLKHQRTILWSDQNKLSARLSPYWFFFCSLLTKDACLLRDDIITGGMYVEAGPTYVNNMKPFSWKEEGETIYKRFSKKKYKNLIKYKYKYQSRHSKIKNIIFHKHTPWTV